MDIKSKLAQEFNIKQEHSSNIVDLILEGNTIPFIARYRKEMHGSCDDALLRDFNDRLNYLTNLEKRKEEVQQSIEGQGKWTDELAIALNAAETLTEVEDIYRPYKQKKKTRASVAIERGLEPLADIFWAQENVADSIDDIASRFINADLKVNTAAEAVSGAKDIIAERISDDAKMRKILRELCVEKGEVVARLADPENLKPAAKEKLAVYEMYKEYSEPIKSMPSHRILAINRGENDECLKVGLKTDDEAAIQNINSVFVKDSMFKQIMEEAAADSYTRLIAPSIEREVRNELTDKANEQAIKMFEVNLKPLLMQPPLKGKVILGLDPAYRTGCKIAVVDAEGNVLDYGVIYPTPPQSKVEQAEAKLTELINKHKVDVISIGNGTASKESEIFVSDLIKKLERKVTYAVVNEAGASVYSASKLGSEEFPDYDVAIRSAVSIARRLQDPLAELIKIDVKSIGVGQYQHDMPQKRLSEVLDGVVEDCVNSVGVDLNTASYSLLSRVAGLNTSIAKNIVAARAKKPFRSRDELLAVSKLGPKAFEQCAGFLRIPDSENVLDNTAVHPESYKAAQRILDMFGYASSSKDGLSDIVAKARERGLEKISGECGVGVPTLKDILDEIAKPGRDIRDSLPPPVLRADLMDIKDLKEGMVLKGVVRNVIDFGAFVDIGVHQDGLVHISQICNRYISHPSEVLSVGENVTVKVLAADPVKKRISLTMKLGDEGEQPRAEHRKDEKGNRLGNNNRRDGDRREDRRQVQNESLQDKLRALQAKFSKK